MALHHPRPAQSRNQGHPDERHHWSNGTWPVMIPPAALFSEFARAAATGRPLDERKRNRTVVFEDYLVHLRHGTELSA